MWPITEIEAPTQRQVTSWRGYATLTVLATAFSTALIAGSYRHLSHTFDEMSGNNAQGAPVNTVASTRSNSAMRA